MKNEGLLCAVLQKQNRLPLGTNNNLRMFLIDFYNWLQRLFLTCILGCVIRSFSSGKFHTVQKVSVFVVILVRIFPHSHILLRISPFSVRMWKKNAGKIRTRITPDTDTFYGVSHCQISAGKFPA